MADILVHALRGEPDGGKLVQHRRFAVAREPKPRTQAPIVGEQRAREAGDRGDEEAVGGGEAQQRGGIGCGADMRRENTEMRAGIGGGFRVRAWLPVDLRL